MFCPTAIDEFFEKKFSQLDMNFNKKTQLTYRDRVSFEDRVKEAEDTRSRYPNKVPLVIERHRSEKYLPAIDKVNNRQRKSPLSELDHLFSPDKVAGAAGDESGPAERRDQGAAPGPARR